MRIVIIIICLLIKLSGSGQPSIAITLGYSVDLNKKSGNAKTFTNIPFSLQWIPGNSGNRFVPFIKLDYLIPITKTYLDPAFTTNPSLPATINVEKSIKPAIACASGGLRFRVFTKDRHTFYADALLTAVNYQNIKVSYGEYDKDNYEILNPDVRLHKTGAAIGLGIVYKLSLTSSNSLLCMLHMQSPPFVSSKVNKYELSYRLVAPLQMTIGYSFTYKESKTA